MWRAKEPQPTAQSTSTPKFLSPNSSSSSITAQASWVSPTMKVKGEISADEDLLVDGKVEGSVSVGEHRLTVGNSGQIDGGLRAREIIVYGKVAGNKKVVSESIEIKKDASVNGDVTTRRIVIEDGAAFKGSIEIGETGKQTDSKPVEAAARTLSQSA